MAFSRVVLYEVVGLRFELLFLTVKVIINDKVYKCKYKINFLIPKYIQKFLSKLYNLHKQNTG